MDRNNEQLLIQTVNSRNEPTFSNFQDQKRIFSSLKSFGNKHDCCFCFGPSHDTGLDFQFDGRVQTHMAAFDWTRQQGLVVKVALIPCCP